MNKLSYSLLMVSLLCMLFVAVLFSLAWGQMDIPIINGAAVLCQNIGIPFLNDVAVPPEQASVIWHIRMPRTLTAILVGGALALSGAVLQGIFGNPLADPGIIGVSSGASAGAILAIAMGFTSISMYSLPVAAMAGSILAVGLTIALATRKGRIPTLALLLSGVVVGMFLSAFTAAILTVINENKMQEYLFWTIGGMDYRRWEHVIMGCSVIIPAAAIVLTIARQLNILALGEVEAKALGMSVGRVRLLFLFLSSAITATAVSISGNIGFVGLVIPHLMRMLSGADHRKLLPVSMLAGAVFLLLCDALGRIIISGAEIRVGIMTAFIGTPYFLYLLRKQQSNLE